MTKSPVPQNRPPLTAERLRELLRYDTETDQWTRLTGRNAGKPVGSITKQGALKIVVDGEQYLATRLKCLYCHGEWPHHRVMRGEAAIVAPETSRACRKCGVVKPIEDFPKASGCKSGRRGTCQVCRSMAIKDWKRRTDWRPKPEAVQKKKEARVYKPRNSRLNNLSSKYGITSDHYDAILERQGGACALCQKPAGRSNRWGTLSVDHCHETGLIRGLLCAACNSALGMLGDTPERLQRALDYVNGKLSQGSAPPIFVRKINRSKR